ETVTLNADKSLTVVDNDATGGSITTTLRANGTGGVDVTNNAQNVDLGGSLFGHAEYRMDRGDENGVPGMTPYGTVSTPAAALSSFGFTAPFGEQTPSLSGSLENDIALM
ncbi:MAG: hypothetical protein IAI50_04905, partial [Candidatus Eremiobacteraeota bacterium]|nr:hypothetical protein [Candidatus Eremiobacteraeota bacterium]